VATVAGALLILLAFPAVAGYRGPGEPPAVRSPGPGDRRAADAGAPGERLPETP
jgi:hypothetical protein